MLIWSVGSPAPHFTFAALLRLELQFPSSVNASQEFTGHSGSCPEWGVSPAPRPVVRDRVKQKHSSDINVTAIQDVIVMTFCAFVCFLVRVG